jgi:deoxyuridine 5'-triphosphate nucleotidohydrolase
MPWKTIPSVKVKLLYADSKIPFNRNASPSGDAGNDVYSVQTHILQDRERKTIGTGIALELPPGYYGRITGRSGWTRKGLDVRDGTIDSDYRGEIHVTVENNSGQAVLIEEGMRIAQFIVVPFATVQLWESVSELSDTSRGSNGFGSSGYKEVI